MPTVALPGFSFSQTISSAKFFGGKLALPTTTSDSLQSARSARTRSRWSKESAEGRAVDDVGLPMAENEGVAIGRGMRDMPGADSACCPGQVFYHDGLAERPCHSIGETAPKRIGRPTGREGTTMTIGRDG